MKCQSCSAPKDANTVDEPADPDAPPVTDVKLLEQANQGENWVCEFCKGQVRNAEGKCTNCAAPKVQADFTLPKILRPPSTPIPSDGSHKVTGPLVSGEAWVVIAIAAFIITLTSTGIWFLIPHEVKATVSLTHWEYNIVLEQRSVVHQEGWGINGDAFNIACASKYYGDENCNPYDCNPHTVNYKCRCSSYDCHCTKVCKSKKNGYSSCRDSCNTCTKCDVCTRTEYSTCYHQCPVYKNWCNYDRYVWTPIDNKTTSGEDPLEVTWPPIAAQGPEQREVKTAKYLIQFAVDDKQWEYTTTFLDLFQRFKKGDRYNIKVNGTGLVAVLDKVE